MLNLKMRIKVLHKLINERDIFVRSINRWITTKNRSYQITFVSNIGAASTNDSPHTPKSDFLELLIVQMERAFMGITITMNLSNKRKYSSYITVKKLQAGCAC